MHVMLLGMIVFLHPAIKVLDTVSIIALQLLRESYFVFLFSTDIEVRLLQSEKTSLPIDITLLGIIIEVRLLQPMKAALPINFTLLGISIEVRSSQSQNILNIDNQSLTL